MYKYKMKVIYSYYFLFNASFMSIAIYLPLFLFMPNAIYYKYNENMNNIRYFILLYPHCLTHILCWSDLLIIFHRATES